jgi:SAM-dependent methyltransferase
VTAADWDARYRAQELVWGVAPNRWVAQELSDLAPGRALDVACGEGRNALWLAARGWQVTAVEFSAVALDKARALEKSQPGVGAVHWVLADATSYHAEEPVDVALLCYLQLPAPERRLAVRAAADALAAGATLLVVAHDSRNLADGTGGPQYPQVLYTAQDVVEDLRGTDLTVERAAEVLRPVDGAERPAIDCLVRARRN